MKCFPVTRLNFIGSDRAPQPSMASPQLCVCVWGGGVRDAHGTVRTRWQTPSPPRPDPAGTAACVFDELVTAPAVFCGLWLELRGCHETADHGYAA